MLASIHPLGERARRQRWWLTVSAYLAATVAASAGLGGVLGLVGSWAHPPTAGPGAALGAGITLAALALLGVALDLRVGGLAVPTIHRQVDEEWLQLYRGWVYGAGYGFQLGLGVVTVVNSFTVYLALLLALLTGSLWGGLAVGIVFGVARGLVILAAAGVHSPERLHDLHRRLQGWDGASHRLAVGVQALVAVVAVAVAASAAWGATG